METFVNKICLGPLLHNCLVLYAENANPGFGKEAVYPGTAGWDSLGICWMRLSNWCVKRSLTTKIPEAAWLLERQHKSLSAGGVCL